jgi:hypothetical protein
VGQRLQQFELEQVGSGGEVGSHSGEDLHDDPRAGRGQGLPFAEIGEGRRRLGLRAESRSENGQYEKNGHGDTFHLPTFLQ